MNKIDKFENIETNSPSCSKICVPKMIKNLVFLNFEIPHTFPAKLSFYMFFGGNSLVAAKRVKITAHGMMVLIGH